MLRLGMAELVVVFLVVFLLFGPKALPDIAKGLGEFLRNFKKSMTDINSEIASIDESQNIVDKTDPITPEKDEPSKES